MQNPSLTDIGARTRPRRISQKYEDAAHQPQLEPYLETNYRRYSIEKEEAENDKLKFYEGIKTFDNMKKQEVEERRKSMIMEDEEVQRQAENPEPEEQPHVLMGPIGSQTNIDTSTLGSRSQIPAEGSGRKRPSISGPTGVAQSIAEKPTQDI